MLEERGRGPTARRLRAKRSRGTTGAVFTRGDLSAGRGPGPTVSTTRIRGRDSESPSATAPAGPAREQPRSRSPPGGSFPRSRIAVSDVEHNEHKRRTRPVRSTPACSGYASTGRRPLRGAPAGRAGRDKHEPACGHCGLVFAVPRPAGPGLRPGPGRSSRAHGGARRHRARLSLSGPPPEWSAAKSWRRTEAADASGRPGAMAGNSVLRDLCGLRGQPVVDSDEQGRTPAGGWSSHQLTARSAGCRSTRCRSVRSGFPACCWSGAPGRPVRARPLP